MKNKIKENINNPEVLEQLYQQNKQDYSKSFTELSEEYNSDLVKFWKIRLAHETDIKAQEFSKPDLLIVLLLSLVTGLLAKLPTILSQINTEFFYTRNLAIIIFNGIILYTFWQNKIFNKKRLLTYGLIVLILALFLNLLPNTGSDSVMLSMIHSPLLLWCLFGLSFISFDYKNMAKRIEFIRFNGELLIMTGLFLISGGMLTGITIGLFSEINMDIERFYMENIVIIGGVAAPIISFYLIRLYPTITNKIAPVIARVFTPLVLITLAVYLVSIIFSQSNIFEDRNLLLLFNVMLIAVMAIIVFSISELDKSKKKNINVWFLFLLASLAIIINSIALIAIILRATEGFTPNRTVVLISNILIFVNLVLIARHLYKSYYDPNQLNTVEQTVAKYLTIYAGYTIIVIFILPFLFGLK
ncbi:MAG: DUF4153 domain-containing protein [Candidatus Marinimicrobia bacterium]|nr:DUF4153 domain-containing protein [Candidatus Neomarinimicrobiota bacterium]